MEFEEYFRRQIELWGSGTQKRWPQADRDHRLQGVRAQAWLWPWEASGIGASIW